jgi:hypothetical protein
MSCFERFSRRVSSSTAHAEATVCACRGRACARLQSESAHHSSRTPICGTHSSPQRVSHSIREQIILQRLQESFAGVPTGEMRCSSRTMYSTALWPGMVRGLPSGPKRPMRGPATQAPARPATPPTMCTAPADRSSPEPAQSAASSRSPVTHRTRAQSPPSSSKMWDKIIEEEQEQGEQAMK